MKLSDKKGVQQIVTALAMLGLKDVVICPGSRNAPFILSFNRHGAFDCTSIRDERSAGFFALGKIIERGKPVAIVCTSGSAALNFAPAISEAYYQRLPLIVITADRPRAWTGQGDGQTINQSDIYRNHIRAFYELNGDAEDEDALWYNSRCVCEGYAIATCKDTGPVHFNVPMKEPLYGEAEPGADNPKIFVASKRGFYLEKNALNKFEKIYSSASKVMILAGQSAPGINICEPSPYDLQYPQPATQSAPNASLVESIKKMAAFSNTIVLTESTSNIHHDDFIENIDRCITTMLPEECASFMPELLITVGGAVVSKRIKALLRKYKPGHHWNIDPYDACMDTYQSLTNAVFMAPDSFFDALQVEHTTIKSDYKQKWLDRKQEFEMMHHSFIKEAAYSDFFVFEKIMKSIPAKTYLHLSNSSPVRYAQLFDNKHIAFSWSNRGTSGIDGCTSTAAGAAAASPEKQFLLITGDIAFYYDINALWTENKMDNLKIILINNGGGGIFRIISGEAAGPEMHRFFETAQQRTASDIAAAYGWDYLSANNPASLANSLTYFFDTNRKKIILEIITPADKNTEVLQQYWNYLKENYRS